MIYKIVMSLILLLVAIGFYHIVRLCIAEFRACVMEYKRDKERLTVGSHSWKPNIYIDAQGFEHTWCNEKQKYVCTGHIPR